MSETFQRDPAKDPRNDPEFVKKILENLREIKRQKGNIFPKKKEETEQDEKPTGEEK